MNWDWNWWRLITWIALAVTWFLIIRIFQSQRRTRALLASAKVRAEEIDQIVYDMDARNRRAVFAEREQCGWWPFGTHLDRPDLVLEFDGVEDDGLPRWERVRAE